MGCIFCQIAKGKIKSEIILKNDDIVAVRDISPKAKVHIVIFPKKHLAKSAYERKSNLVLKEVFDAIRSIAKKTGIDKTGFRIVTNHLSDAGQTINHVHFHLLGGQGLGRMCD